MIFSMFKEKEERRGCSVFQLASNMEGRKKRKEPGEEGDNVSDVSEWGMDPTFWVHAKLFIVQVQKLT